MIDAKITNYPIIFENFGFGSALFLISWYFNIFPVPDVTNLNPIAKNSSGFSIAFATAAVFLLYGFGRLCGVLGSAIGGLTFYNTVLRFEHHFFAAAKYSERDWEFFLSLKRDLALIEGFLGMATILLICSFLSLIYNEPAMAMLYPLIFLSVVILGSFNGIWQNRVRVELLAKLNSTIAPVLLS